MESFNALLQKNALDQQRWETRDELRLTIVRWIERTCNGRRRQRELGKLTPIEYETIYSTANAASITQPAESTEAGADPNRAQD